LDSHTAARPADPALDFGPYGCGERHDREGYRPTQAGRRRKRRAGAERHVQQERYRAQHAGHLQLPVEDHALDALDIVAGNGSAARPIAAPMLGVRAVAAPDRKSPAKRARSRRVHRFREVSIEASLAACLTMFRAAVPADRDHLDPVAEPLAQLQYVTVQDRQA
jgi:hypothetical protein